MWYISKQGVTHNPMPHSSHQYTDSLLFPFLLQTKHRLVGLTFLPVCWILLGKCWFVILVGSWKVVTGNWIIVGKFFCGITYSSKRHKKHSIYLFILDRYIHNENAWKFGIKRYILKTKLFYFQKIHKLMHTTCSYITS